METVCRESVGYRPGAALRPDWPPAAVGAALGPGQAVLPANERVDGHKGHVREQSLHQIQEGSNILYS